MEHDLNIEIQKVAPLLIASKLSYNIKKTCTMAFECKKQNQHT